MTLRRDFGFLSPGASGAALDRFLRAGRALPADQPTRRVNDG